MVMTWVLKGWGGECLDNGWRAWYGFWLLFHRCSLNSIWWLQSGFVGYKSRRLDYPSWKRRASLEFGG